MRRAKALARRALNSPRVHDRNGHVVPTCSWATALSPTSTKSSHSRYSSRLPLIASKKRLWIAWVSSPGGPSEVVVDLAHRHDLGRGAGQEDLVGLVQLAARDVALHDLEAEVGGDLHDRPGA